MGDPRIPALLSDLRVVDVSSSIAGLYCSKVLADFGASVTLVCPPDVDGIHDVDDERAAVWNDFLNLDKRVLRPVDRSAWSSRVSEMAPAADILIDSFDAGDLRLEELTAASQQNVKLVRTSVTPFGREGEYSGWRSDEVVEYAMSGQMYLAGDRAREPLLVPGMQGQLHAGLHAAFASLAAARFAKASGLGQEVEVTVLEALLSAHNWLIAAWTHRGRVLHRDVSQVVKCKDGYVVFVPRSYNTELFAMIGRPELLSDERFSTFPAFVKNHREFWRIFEEWAQDHEKLEIWEIAQAFRIANCPVLSPEEALALPQTEARGWLRSKDNRHYPGGPMIVSQSRGLTDGNGRATEATVRDGLPLSGITVLELTSNWAGPLAARHLADLGADVVKIEFARKPATRGGYYPGDDPQRYHFNRSAYFNKMNRNKLGLSLDLSGPLGRAAFLKLVDSADVVIENNSPRVMPNLGLAFEDLSARNPRIIMASLSAFGSAGPISNYIAFGVNIEGSSGLVSAVGYSDSELFGMGNNHGDSIAAGYTATAVLAALHDRARTGRGAFLDVAIQECSAAFLAETYLRTLRDLPAQEPKPVQDDGSTMRCLAKCMGDDSWLVAAVRAEDDLPRLLGCLGAGRLPPDFSLLSGPQRSEFNTAFALWAAQHDHREASRALQDIGIASGAVLKNWEILSDNHLAHRQFFRHITHPEVGTWPFPGFPWRLSRTPGQIRRPAPLFAQHTEEVLRDYARLSNAEVVELEVAGLVAREPIQPVIRGA